MKFLYIASSTVNFENEAFNVISQITLTHADLTVNANHAIMQAMR